VLWLAAGTYTTGTILTVDGGARWAMPGGGDAAPPPGVEPPGDATPWA
jgi:hypothetical protein